MAITKEVNIVVKESGLDEVNKKVNKLENSVESLEDQQRSLSKSMGDSSQSVLDNGGAMGLLNDATGGLAMTVKDAVEASWLFTKSQKAAAIQQAIATTVVGTSTGAMKAFRIALAATGIGLIVIGLGLLIANFDKVKKVVLNLVPGLALVGDFVMGIVESITDFIGVTSEAERALASLTEQADKSLAMNKKFMSEQGDLLNDYTKQKIDAKNRYLEAIKEEGANQTALAARLNRELLAIDKKHDDDLGKVRKDKQDKIDEENKKLSEKQKAEEQKKLDERIQARKDELSKFNDIEKEFEAQREEKNIEKLKAEEEAKKKVTTDIEATLKARQNGLDAERKEAEERIALDGMVKDAKVDIANQTLSLISEIAGKGSKIAKATAIAQATLSGIQGVQNAFTTASASPITTVFPAYPFSQAGLAGAFSALQIAKIAKGDKPSGGGSSSGGGGQSPQAPSFNLVQGTGRNQIAEGLNKQAPVKAYVVSKDMTTGQSMDRNIISSASL